MSVEQGPQLLEVNPDLVELESNLVQREMPHRSLSERMRSSRAGIALATIAVTVAGGAASAEGNNNVPLTEDCTTEMPALTSEGATLTGETCTTTIANFAHAKGKSSDVASAKFEIYTNMHARLPKAKVKKLEDKGRCFEVGAGTDTPWILNQGHNGTGVGYGEDHRSQTVCRYDGALRSTLCGNKVIIPEQPIEHPVQDLFLNNKAKGKVTGVATAHSESTAKATCENGTFAEGHGEGYAKAKFAIRIKALLKAQAHGEGGLKIKSVVSGEAAGKAVAKAKSSAKAGVVCETVTPPPPPENLPPTVEVDHPNHQTANFVIPFCERENDVDGTIEIRDFQADKGNFTSGVYAGNDENEYCRDYRAPSTPNQDAHLSVKVTDNDGDSAIAHATIPIVDIPK